MKSIGICYSEQAVKVSNSHSSTPSDQHQHQVLSSSSSNLPSIQHDSTMVTNCYKVKLSTGKLFLIKLTWSKPGFWIAVSEYFPICPSKKGEKSIVLQRARGMKHFELRGSKIEVYWDFCRSQYDSGPEPVTGFYVVVLVDSELSLVLGDMEHEKRVSNIYSAEFKLISRREIFSGYACYSGRARFCDKGECHDVLIKFTGDDVSRNSILSVYVDKKSVVQVKRLRWNFRGNQTIFVDGLLVDLMWDLHDWFFGPLSSSSSSGLGHGVFLFRTRSGLDSRLWLEEKVNIEKDEQENVGFSLMICACKNPD
ncbi:hypothetical protein PHJA_000956200 [Phtheirospermum japonicum]|uniref:Uncharacterized protein n=1 Tax=Phtheirospermum japonicum TaxID=374723 RepID=A0A830BXN2_9LAMI|nr:hypothetical protein PHJA_000956200 [Phtheirospermum japonicum]